MTKLSAVSKVASSFSTNVLIVGGSFSGLSSVVTLKAMLQANAPTKKLNVTVVEPRAGLLNLLGIPRSIVDPDFAKTQYLPLEGYKGLQFDRLISDDEYVVRSASPRIQPGVNANLSVTYVQGKVTSLSRKFAEYSLNGQSGGANKIEFDYCIIAAGRNRPWPTSPEALNSDKYLKEMTEFNSHVKQSNKIAVVGAGAVGIEIAGDIKTKNPDKEVTLIHPHPTFPPESLSDEFKVEVRKSLERADVKILTGKRVKKELENGHLELTTGETIEADFTYWCTSFKNNTGFLTDGLEKFVSVKNNILVNDHLQLYRPEDHELIENIFCVGDMAELPIIKTAGWALAMGRSVGTNLVHHLNGEKLESFSVDRPRSMLLVCGNEDIVADQGGRVLINDKDHVESYKTYRFSKVRGTLHI